MNKEDINKIFSENLLYWLEQRGKTQADLYREMDVSSATASDWCNCKKMPRTDKLVAIAKWLMIELSDLITVKEKKEVSEIDKIIFRLKDDESFFKTVSELNKFDNELYQKVGEYIELLKK